MDQLSHLKREKGVLRGDRVLAKRSREDQAEEFEFPREYPENLLARNR